MNGTSLGRWWLVAASWLTLAWLASHAVGVAMTVVFEHQVGFFPVWFFDCIACTGSDFSLPYTAPQLILGVSVAGLVAGLSAIAIVATRHRPLDHWATILGVALLASNGIHAAVTWAYRFPGSLPTIVASILIPAIAMVIAAIGTFGTSAADPVRLSRTPLRERVKGWMCLASGVVAVSLLGGVAAVIAAAGCGWHLTTAQSARQRAFALAGLSLALVGTVIRLRIRARFPGTTGLL